MKSYFTLVTLIEEQLYSDSNFFYYLEANATTLEVSSTSTEMVRPVLNFS
jgi:hypothetical protein